MMIDLKLNTEDRKFAAELLSRVGSGATVIVIPHDIEHPTVVAVKGEGRASIQKFDSIALREAISQAERRRLDNEFKRTTEKLKAVVLPEE